MTTQRQRDLLDVAMARLQALADALDAQRTSNAERLVDGTLRVAVDEEGRLLAQSAVALERALSELAERARDIRDAVESALDPSQEDTIPGVEPAKLSPSPPRRR